MVIYKDIVIDERAVIYEGGVIDEIYAAIYERTTVHECTWLYMNGRDYTWMRMIIHEHMIIHGCAQLYMYVHDCTWMHVIIHEHTHYKNACDYNECAIIIEYDEVTVPIGLRSGILKWAPNTSHIFPHQIQESIQIKWYNVRCYERM